MCDCVSAWWTEMNWLPILGVSWDSWLSHLVFPRMGSGTTVHWTQGKAVNEDE